MKIKAVMLLCLLSLFSSAQEISSVKIGVDYWLMKKNYDNSEGEVTYNPKIGLFVEKPIPLDFIEKLVVNPGINYKNINEVFRRGGLGGGESGDLNHHTIGAYIKVIRNTKISLFKKCEFYYGGLVGVQIYSWLTGSQSKWNMGCPQCSCTDADCGTKSDLYNRFNFGIMGGLTLNQKANINPSLELRFLPYYANYKGNVLNPVEVALLLEIGKRKLKEK